MKLFAPYAYTRRAPAIRVICGINFFESWKRLGCLSLTPTPPPHITGGRVWVWSRRAITAGDEITLDYGAEYFDEFIGPAGCRCEACAEGATRERA